MRIADILSRNCSKSFSLASSTCRSLLSSITSNSFVDSYVYYLRPLDVSLLIEAVVMVVEASVDPKLDDN